jgi:magnesium-transporting ATPase (P-type)
VIKPPQALFQPDWSSMWLSFFALIGCLFFLVSLLLLKLKRFNEKWRHPLVMVATALTTSIYPIYIIVCLASHIYNK